MDHIAYDDRFGHLVFSGNPTFLSLNHEGPENFLTLTAGYVLSQTAVLILYFSLRKFLIFLLLSLNFQQVCFFVSLGGAGLSYNGNNCYCLQLG